MHETEQCPSAPAAAAELDFVTDYEGVLLPIEVIDPTVRFVVPEKLSLP